MPTEEILQLPKYGIAGVMIALILLCGYLAFLLYKIVGNHINHSNECFDRNTKALSELGSAINNNTKVTEKLASEVRFKNNN